MVRLHYIDNLRWMCILLLFPIHAAIVFCAGWYGFYVLSDYSSTAARCLMVFIEPWIMPLLFCIAGMSTKFALQKRTPLVFLKERVTKLLVPFLAGLVLVCPVIAFYALKFHSGYTGSFAGAFVVAGADGAAKAECTWVARHSASRAMRNGRPDPRGWVGMVFILGSSFGCPRATPSPG